MLSPLPPHEEVRYLLWCRGAGVVEVSIAWSTCGEPLLLVELRRGDASIVGESRSGCERVLLELGNLRLPLNGSETLNELLSALRFLLGVCDVVAEERRVYA